MLAYDLIRSQDVSRQMAEISRRRMAIIADPDAQKAALAAALSDSSEEVAWVALEIIDPKRSPKLNNALSNKGDAYLTIGLALIEGLGKQQNPAMQGPLFSRLTDIRICGLKGTIPEGITGRLKEELAKLDLTNIAEHLRPWPAGELECPWHRVTE